jgi:hypothetical protein
VLFVYRLRPLGPADLISQSIRDGQHGQAKDQGAVSRDWVPAATACARSSGVRTVAPPHIPLHIRDWIGMHLPFQLTTCHKFLTIC